MSKNKATYILCLKMMHLKIKAFKLTTGPLICFNEYAGPWNPSTTPPLSPSLPCCGFKGSREKQQ